GLPDVGTKSFPKFTSFALHAVPPAVMTVGAILGTAYAALKRRAARVTLAEGPAAAHDSDHHPLTFEPIRHPLWTPFNYLLLALIVAGVISLVVRFALGL